MENLAINICSDISSNKKPIFKIVDNTNNIKYNLDGSIKKTHSNKIEGVSSEVYAFKDKEEIKAIINVLNDRIINSEGLNRQIAYRNKLLFVIGINIGIRASDLRLLKWNFFIDNNGDFKKSYTIQPKKQRKQHKFVTLYFNDTVKKAIYDYILEYPIDDLDSYLFFSRKGSEPISEHNLWKIIKETAAEAGIKQNIGSHSLRKTWGFWCWHSADDKNKALVILQQCFNHSSTQTTMHYIGLIDDEIEEMYNSIELGMEFL